MKILRENPAAPRQTLSNFKLIRGQPPLDSGLAVQATRAAPPGGKGFGNTTRVHTTFQSVDRNDELVLKIFLCLGAL